MELQARWGFADGLFDRLLDADIILKQHKISLLWQLCSTGVCHPAPVISLAGGPPVTGPPVTVGQLQQQLADRSGYIPQCCMRIKLTDMSKSFTALPYLPQHGWWESLQALQSPCTVTCTGATYKESCPQLVTVHQRWLAMAITVSDG